MIYFSPVNVNFAIVVLIATKVVVTTANCTRTTGTIGCGGSNFNNSEHSVYTCEYPIYTRVELPNCRSNINRTTLFWYSRADFCNPSRPVFGRFFASYPTSTNEPCKNLENSTVSLQSCKQDYIFNNVTMIIKNLTEFTVPQYICFVGDNQLEMVPDSGVTYMIKIQESTTTTTTIDSSSTSGSSSITTNNDSTVTDESTSATESPSSKSNLHIILPAVLVPTVVIIITVFIGIFFYRRHRKSRKEEDHSLEWFPSQPSRSTGSIERRGSTDLARPQPPESAYRAWRPVKARP